MFDVNKPIKTRRGHEAVIILLTVNYSFIGGRNVLARYRISTGEWQIGIWYLDGHFYPPQNGVPRIDQMDLVNV